jgi:hypothetical protein
MCQTLALGSCAFVLGITAEASDKIIRSRTARDQPECPPLKLPSDPGSQIGQESLPICSRTTQKLDKK